MSNNLQKIIERQLNDYSSDIDVWDQAVGDTFLTFGYRLSLQEQISNLTEDQLKRLYEVDRRVLELAAVNYENINSDDVAFLLRIADVIKTVKL